MKSITRILLLMMAVVLLSGTASAWDKTYESAPLEYQLLFFRNDGRIWIVLPPRTTLVEVYPSIGGKTGWVKAYNREGKVLAKDYFFHGLVISSSLVLQPSINRGWFVVNRHDGTSVGIYTPMDASFVEIVNSRNGFDGMVRVLNRRKQVLAVQSGLHLEIINLK